MSGLKIFPTMFSKSLNKPVSPAWNIFVPSSIVNKKLPDPEEHELHALEDKIDTLTLEAQDNHVQRLKEKKCHTSAGVVYTKLLQDLERVGDHAYNIAWAARKDKNLIRQI